MLINCAPGDVGSVVNEARQGPVLSFFRGPLFYRRQKHEFARLFGHFCLCPTQTLSTFATRPRRPSYSGSRLRPTWPSQGLTASQWATKTLHRNLADESIFSGGDKLLTSLGGRHYYG